MGIWRGSRTHGNRKQERTDCAYASGKDMRCLKGIQQCNEKTQQLYLKVAEFANCPIKIFQ